MSTSDLERQVSDVLHRHATGVMERTDTTRSYARFLERAEQDRRRRRTKASVAAVVAAAAAVAAVEVGPGLIDRGQPAPVDEVVTPAEEVALQMMTALGDQDVAAMSDLLAPDAVMFPQWRAELRFFAAVGSSVDVQLCEELDRWQEGTRVGCVFDLHAFFSETFERGPFPDNTAMVQVLDGEVTRMTVELQEGAGSSQELYEEIATWLELRHPAEAELLLSGWPRPNPATPQRVERYLDLWERLSLEYAAEQSR